MYSLSFWKIEGYHVVCDRCDSKKHITLVQTRVRARARIFVIGFFTFCICLVWVQHLSGVFRSSSSFETNKASSTKQWYVTLKKWLVFRKMWLIFWERWLVFRKMWLVFREKCLIFWERWLVFVNHYLVARSYQFVFSKNDREYVWKRAHLRA